MNTVIKTDIKEYPLFTSGKVRDVYDMDDKLLLIATDRISAFDCVMPNGIPQKGKILTQMSLFWFDLVSDIVDNHLIYTDVKDFPQELQKYSEMLKNRAIIVKKAERFDLECIVRGYITGSGMKDYKKTGNICGIELPKGLVESQKLDKAIFTPSTKAAEGLHDENISVKEAENLVGKENADALADLTLRIYEKARAYADTKGIIIADTKFEFGISGGKIILIDEILSPDSSRFWPKDEYKVGENQNSYDKQYVRNYLSTLDWNKNPPAPALPEEVIAYTLEKYKEAYIKICGKDPESL